MTHVALNNTQWDIIRAFSFARTEKTQIQIKTLLSDFFAQQAEEEMDKLWDEGKWDEDKNEAILKEHLRTPYKSMSK